MLFCIATTETMNLLTEFSILILETLLISSHKPLSPCSQNLLLGHKDYKTLETEQEQHIVLLIAQLPVQFSFE
jgi:hypothetical protein